MRAGTPVTHPGAVRPSLSACRRLSRPGTHPRRWGGGAPARLYGLGGVGWGGTPVNIRAHSPTCVSGAGAPKPPSVFDASLNIRCATVTQRRLTACAEAHQGRQSPLEGLDTVHQKAVRSGCLRGLTTSSFVDHANHTPYAFERILIVAPVVRVCP